MSSKVKTFSPIKVGLFLLIALGSFSLRLADAQTNQTGEIPAGYTLIDGDILMPTSFVNGLLQRKTQTPNVPTATYNTNFWPNGIVPFEFDANVTAGNQAIMVNAMAVLENVANVDFQQCPANDCDDDYVHIQNSAANNSFVGKIGGQQIINIVSWNNQFRLVHELLHCLGFFHEQTRPGRNNYVQINCNNLQGGCNGGIYMANFEIEDEASAYGYYDFDSVMHYGQCDFSIDCPADNTCNCVNTTITVLAPNTAQWQTAIGQRTHLSTMDQAALSFFYPFSNWRFLDCNYNGGNGASNGTFRRPYTSFATAFNNTPAGGTIWVLRTCNFAAVGIYNKQIKVKAAPGVTARLGD
jgi:hypothetical protein